MAQNGKEHTSLVRLQSVLSVLGTEIGCGKTVLLTGLAAVLREQGFQIRAIKPIAFGQTDVRVELEFINSIARCPASEYVCLRVDQGLNEAGWRAAINLILAQIASDGLLTLAELPGSCSMPLRYGRQSDLLLGGDWQDVSDLAKEFAGPVLLVAKHNEWLLEKISLAAHYVQTKGLKLLGFVSVETTLDEGKILEACFSRERIEMSLLARTGIPYLGCVKYSHSISVPRVSQGNLIKLTASSIDYLGIIKGLDLPVPAF